jgi:hypothetical protein
LTLDIPLRQTGEYRQLRPKHMVNPDFSRI